MGAALSKEDCVAVRAAMELSFAFYCAKQRGDELFQKTQGPRVLFIRGPSGLGKSSLAHSLAPCFGKRVCVLDLDYVPTEHRVDGNGFPTSEFISSLLQENPELIIIPATIAEGEHTIIGWLKCLKKVLFYAPAYLVLNLCAGLQKSKEKKLNGKDAKSKDAFVRNMIAEFPNVADTEAALLFCALHSIGVPPPAISIVEGKPQFSYTSEEECPSLEAKVLLAAVNAVASRAPATEGLRILSPHTEGWLSVVLKKFGECLKNNRFTNQVQVLPAEGWIERWLIGRLRGEATTPEMLQELTSSIVFNEPVSLVWPMYYFAAPDPSLRAILQGPLDELLGAAAQIQDSLHLTIAYLGGKAPTDPNSFITRVHPIIEALGSTLLIVVHRIILFTESAEKMIAFAVIDLVDDGGSSSTVIKDGHLTLLTTGGFAPKDSNIKLAEFRATPTAEGFRVHEFSPPLRVAATLGEHDNTGGYKKAAPAASAASTAAQ